MKKLIMILFVISALQASAQQIFDMTYEKTKKERFTYRNNVERSVPKEQQDYYFNSNFPDFALAKLVGNECCLVTWFALILVQTENFTQLEGHNLFKLKYDSTRETWAQDSSRDGYAIYESPFFSIADFALWLNVDKMDCDCIDVLKRRGYGDEEMYRKLEYVMQNYEIVITFKYFLDIGIYDDE